MICLFSHDTHNNECSTNTFITHLLTGQNAHPLSCTFKKTNQTNKNHLTNCWQTVNKYEVQVSRQKIKLLQKMISSLKQILLGHSQAGSSDFKQQAGPEMSFCLLLCSIFKPNALRGLQPWESHITQVGFNVLQQKCRKAMACHPSRQGLGSEH